MEGHLTRTLSTLLLLLFSACSPQNAWIHRKVCSDCARFNSTQLIYCSQSSYSGIEVQFLKGEFGIIGSLNVYAYSIQTPTLLFRIEDETYSFEGIVMEGGQKLQLPPEATDLLIQALLDGHKVQIFMGQFYTELEANKKLKAAQFAF